MNRTHQANRFVPALGVAVGGLLAATFLPMGVAFADDYIWEPNSGVQEHIDYTTGIPPFYQEVLGTGDFYFEDPAAGSGIAEFNAQLSEISTPFGISNEELLVDDPVYGDAPHIGSVLDTLNFGNGFENVYVDLVGAGPNGTNLITDVFDTPFGDFTIPTTFDAAALSMGDIFTIGPL